MRRLAFLVLLVSATAFAAPPAAPKNVILFISDGGGLAHYTSLRNAKPDANISRLPVVGLATTRCLNRAVTDSAAAASALATGSKVNYEAVSQDAEGKPLKTALEAAEAAGRVTGLVTTSYFYDATPCAFASHASHRDQYESIVEQMLQSGAELILGAGRVPVGEKELVNAASLAQKNGYTLVKTRAELDAAANASRVLSIFPQQTRDLDFPEAPLPVLTRFALERLKANRAGFFLMVEHEGTDSSSHQNNGPDMNAAIQSFDAAIGVALDFAAAAGDTLVIVTSDHETGGLRVSETKTARFRLEWSTTDHTGSAVPVFAFGPGSAELSGFYDNTDIGKKLIGWVSAKK